MSWNQIFFICIVSAAVGATVGFLVAALLIDADDRRIEEENERATMKD